jgi:hypothetical protein
MLNLKSSWTAATNAETERMQQEKHQDVNSSTQLVHHIFLTSRRLNAEHEERSTDFFEKTANPLQFKCAIATAKLP